ncbi:MAG: DUF547 domain-containing protein [Planctomycetota bacterium]
MLLSIFALAALANLSQPGMAPPTESAVQATAAEFDQSHRLWNEVLQEHVKDDRFDYAALKKDRGKLDDYIKQLQTVKPDDLKDWSKNERYAFWINVYNAHTILKVIDNYPVDSIKDLSGAFGLKSVFDNEFIKMKAHHPEGTRDKMSLNDIEHGILRERFKDARVHAAINCASFSCPPLLGEAFVAAKLEEQLNKQMRAFVVDKRRNRFNRDKKRAEISEIFKWFSEDFERDAGSVRDYLIRFAPEEDAAFLKDAKIKHLDYDWDLNDVKK